MTFCRYTELWLKQGKDVAALFFNSQKLDSNTEKVIKSFGKAANRFKELKIKTVRMAYYDLAKLKAPEGLNVDSLPKIYVMPSEHKSAPFEEITEYDTENIMLEVQAKADIKFDLPSFPHLKEEEFRAYETGVFKEDL